MPKRSKFNQARLRYRAFLFLLILVFSFSFSLLIPRVVYAQDVNQGIANILKPITDFAKKAYEKGGAAALQTAIRKAMNKIAYDSAKWIGSGGKGQKPLFVTEDWGTYLGKIGDEAAGDFLESAVKNWNNADFKTDGKGTKQNEQCKKAYDACPERKADEQDACFSKCDKIPDAILYGACFNECLDIWLPLDIEKSCYDELMQCSGVMTGGDGVTQSVQVAESPLAPLLCEPSSIDFKLRIALNLVDNQRPQAPNCVASEMVKNWEDEYKRQHEYYTDPHFLQKFSNIFNPNSNDLGIFYQMSVGQKQNEEKAIKEFDKKLIADDGYLDLRDIAGNMIGTPKDAKRKLEIAEQGYINNMGQFTGDALIDAANVFLNQLAISFFNTQMSNLGKDVIKSTSNANDFKNPDYDPQIRYGEGKVVESLAKIIEPDFSIKGDYDILASLNACRDRKNPGPTECVIDDRFMQGAIDKLTVAEAMKQGSLHADWQFTTDFSEGTYNLRNIQILRKYRIVPLTWEIAASNNKKATLMDLVSCFSAHDEHNSYSSGFSVADQGWCRGLVDPDWVLKAPLNYCSAQGFSSQLLNINVIPSYYEDKAVRDEISITRAEDYCGDEKTCINENADGSCETYGYCLSEQSTWNFNSPTCEPINNTCSSFYDADGKKVSYLENTLDYSGCSADSVGCQRYSTHGSYSTSTGQITWSANPFFNPYFNDKLGNCSADSEGCHELMRVQQGSKVNLIMGADFAADEIGDKSTSGRINNYWTVWSPGATGTAEIIDSSELNNNFTGKAILASSTASTTSLYSNNITPLVPADLNIDSGETYTLSADVYLKTGSQVRAVLGDDYLAAAQVGTSSDWQHLSVTRDLSEKPLSELAFLISAHNESAGATEFAVKNLKLEMNSYDSGFSAYGTSKIYEKLIPKYLWNTCYEDPNSSKPDYRLKINAPLVCNNYVRQCNIDEAGCNHYTQVRTGFSVAAKTITTDYCDANCDGYNLYISRDNYFYSPQAEKMIPKNSQSCGALAVGCSEFTNLDEVAGGGETRAYYSQLKQCIKPGNECDEFYHWVGTEESGYQLKSVTLKTNASGTPFSTNDDSGTCNNISFNLTPSDPGFNPDCREYYNKEGDIAYRLTAHTVTCSEDCYSYRLSENNIDRTIISNNDCNDVDGHWDATRLQCYVCKNGGEWSDYHQACLYQAIPSESTSCQALDNGCREYNGSLGNNTRLIFANSFDYGLEGWEDGYGDKPLHSPVANSNNGQSMMYDKGANSPVPNLNPSPIVQLNRLINQANASTTPPSYIKKEVAYSVQTGKSYTLKFTASAATNTNVSIAFSNSSELATSSTSYFMAGVSNTFVVRGDKEWRSFELNLAELDHSVNAEEALIIKADNDFYIDNLILTEITDRYYLIRGTSQVPNICYYDILDRYQGSDYNLGCSAYLDRNQVPHYLRQFTKLCQNSSVGCEKMIDTANYDSFKANIWKDADDDKVCEADEPGCIKVEGDRFIYAVYDKTKMCNSADLGCSLLGQAVDSAHNLNWSDVYKLNNPNKYDSIICDYVDDGCEAWNDFDGGGVSYFKKPGTNLCTYRNSNDPETPGKNWYKAPVLRCDINNNGKIDTNELGTKICTSADDCPGNRPCIMDNNDYDCPVSYFETFGYGGGGRQVPVPSESVAVCEDVQSGCSEYIDPISSFSSNLIIDPSYENNSNAWIGSGSGSYQEVGIEPNSLYIFSVNTTETSLAYDVWVESSGVSVLQDDNYLGTSNPNLTISSSTPTQRYIFHSRNNSSVTVYGAHINHEIVLKKAIIAYQFKQQVNKDKGLCNGLVNQKNGCILLNERIMNGGEGLLPLTGYYNAATSTSGKKPVNCTDGNCDSNVLLKVRPDRTCASWLDCKTYAYDEAGEKVCYSVGECNVLDDKGECVNFIKANNEIVTPENNSNLGKLTGYSVLDKYSLSRMGEVGINTTAHFNFEEASPSLYCKTKDWKDCNFDVSLQYDSIVNSPTNAPTDYPAEGRAYLKVMQGHRIVPHSINSPITIPTSSANYLNFLVNTKDSGVKAEVSIYGYKIGNNYKDEVPIAREVFSSNQGWERKIMKFNGNGDLHADKIVIFLSASSTESGAEERYVYFDDINIEPVLEVGGGKYIAKECRLYPSQDSVSCSSVNSKVIQDGWLGYCLEHDPANKNVCLLWYPVDKISASLKSGRSSIGYQGAFPLNYCTEANGNFELVEKRTANKFWDGDFTSFGLPDFQSGQPPGATGISFVGDCSWYGVANEYCPEGYYIVNQIEDHNNRAWCVPRLDKMLTYEGKRIVTKKIIPAAENSDCEITYYEGWAPYNGLQMKAYNSNCLDSPQHVLCTNLDESKNANPPVRIFDKDYPTIIEDELGLISSSDPEKVYYPTCNRFTQVVDSAGNNQAWANRVSKSSAYLFETPLFFRSGNTYYGTSNQCDYQKEECIAKCEICETPLQPDCCNEDTICRGLCHDQYVGWCYETSSILTSIPCDDPICLGNSNPCTRRDLFKFTAYGRNRELIPFGAATIPDNYNIFASPRIKLRNRYSDQINQIAFAGRPYGCFGEGCKNIGYCSLNPNVYCILDEEESVVNSFINENSCGSVNGTCVPLWDGKYLYERTKDLSFKADNILKNIFLTSYEGYLFENDSYKSFKGYDSDGPADESSYYESIYNGGSGNCTTRDCHKTENDDTFSKYWKYILPKIANVKVNGSSLSNPLTVSPGIYKLSFTTTIDKEQQPLRDLIIDWGDGSQQNLVNQNNRPNDSDPHVLYHYYTSSQTITIKIKVTDNWGFYHNWSL